MAFPACPQDDAGCKRLFERGPSFEGASRKFRGIFLPGPWRYLSRLQPASREGLWRTRRPPLKTLKGTQGCPSFLIIMVFSFVSMEARRADGSGRRGGCSKLVGQMGTSSRERLRLPDPVSDGNILKMRLHRWQPRLAGIPYDILLSCPEVLTVVDPSGKFSDPKIWESFPVTATLSRVAVGRLFRNS